MKILVTGGLGFIGSHVVVELQQKGFDVVVIDNLSNSSIDVLNGIFSITGVKPDFEQLDLRDKAAVTGFFKKYKDVAGVVHFAASKAVGESVKNPLLYYENNLNTLVYLLQHLQNKNQTQFIFSSAATFDSLATETSFIKHFEPGHQDTFNYGSLNQAILQAEKKVLQCSA